MDRLELLDQGFYHIAEKHFACDSSPETYHITHCPYCNAVLRQNVLFCFNCQQIVPEYFFYNVDD